MGCGARTPIDLVVAPVLDASAEAGGKAPAGDGGSPVLDGGASNDAGCGEPWVLFVVNDLEQGLYARRSDGTGGHAVPLPHVGPSFPWVSADGAALVYTTEGGDNLYLHLFADGSDQKIATPSGTLSGFAALSPDRTAIAYSTNAGLEYAALSPAGAGPATLLVRATAVGVLGDSPSFPTFTSDGSRIIFGSHAAIGEVEVAAGRSSVLIENPGDFVGVDNASLSPDEQSLVAGVECPAGVYGLRIYPVASLPAGDCTSGRLVVRFDPPGAAPFYPTWGPSGLIAYPDGAGNIILVDDLGTRTRNLTADMDLRGVGPASMPAWAPACTHL